jgi:putative FmdB family regulatory protein
MIYQYQCTKCLKKFEVKKSMSESSRTEHCPECGNPASRKYNVLGVVWSEKNCWDYDKEGLGDNLIHRHDQ